MASLSRNSHRPIPAVGYDVSSTVSPPPPVVANDLFRRASRIRYQRLLGLMGPRLQPFSSGRIRFLPRPARRNHEDKGGVARTTRVQTPRVLFARFVAGRSFRNLGYRTPINPSRDRCHCDLHDHEHWCGRERVNIVWINPGMKMYFYNKKKIIIYNWKIIL